MAEYTYDDIIIDPNSEEAKNAVGKICYFSNSPRNILSDIYRKSAVEGILTNMDDGYFEVDNEGYWDCIILKKEEPKPKLKYIPFESVEEFLDEYFLNKEKYTTGILLKLEGIWLREKDTGAICMATEIWDEGLVIGDTKLTISGTDVFNDTTDWDELFRKYSFVDGTPCGKKIS